MAGGKLDLHQAGTLSKSIDVHMPDFQADIQYTGVTVNVTSGIIEGIGPRYGFAPLAGHQDQETPAAGHFPGLMKFETGANNYTAATTWDRVQIYAIIPLKLKQPGSIGNIAISSTYYAYVVGYTSSVTGGTFIDVLLSSLFISGLISHSSDITAGLQYAGPDSISSAITNVAPTLLSEKIVVPNSLTTITAYTTGATGQRAALLTLLATAPSGNPWCSTTAFSVSGPDVPMAWLVGQAENTPDATHAPDLGFARTISPATGSPTLTFGLPSGFNARNFPLTTRNWVVHGIAALDYAGMTYNASHQATAAIFLQSYNEMGNTNFVASGFAWNKTGGTAYNTVDMGLLFDDMMTSNSSYQGVAIAAGKPIMVLYQDWYRAYLGEMQQYVDLTVLPLPQVNVTSPAVTFGAAGSGILRAKTKYEFGVSIYDKRLNYETNVTSVMTQTTGADDFVNAIMFDTVTFAVGTQAKDPSEALLRIPAIVTSSFSLYSNPQHINYLEYRFYFRQVDMSEWLPALYIDAAKFWFYPLFTGPLALAMCVGAIGGLPGGRINGFNDYSTLPQDTYNCTVMYKNRLFWLSEKALAFSLLNNVFAYPGRNTAACPVGSFKGALVHAYYGQADQDARLVVFGTKATYVGKFTGNLLETPVTLSSGPPGGPPVIGNFGLDGSDFVLNAWTSVTAFSYRAATVAEGILYFWGPQGVFMDDGVHPIQRLSVPLEPDLYASYDASQTDAISCVYNDTTKEIIWFFAPVTADASFPTHGIVWNRVKKSWLYVKFSGQIDGAQILPTDTTGVGTCGTRTVVFARQSASSTIQRAYYYDQRNLCGDMFPTLEMMVKTISTPSAGVRRLTLAAGYNSTNFNTINVGDLIATQRLAAYAGTALTTPSDFIATVAAINHGAGTVDITLPTGATLDGAATIASNANFFPIWHATATGTGLNGYAYTIDSKFWIPAGMSYWAYWNYIHMVFKLYALLPGPAPTISLGYQSPISKGTATDTLMLTNNSQGNCQILHALAPVSSNWEGQGIKLTLSGIQLAGAWVLQFLEAYAQMKDGMELKQFEG